MDAAKTKHATVMDPTELSVGERYAQALLGLLGDDAQATEVAAELDGIVSAWEQVAQARELLSGGLLGRSRRTELLKRVFGGRVSERVEAFLAVLDRHDRMGALPAVAMEFNRLLNVRQGKIEVTLTTALPLDAEATKAIEDGLATALKARPILRIQVDESLLGGAVVRVGDRVYDASLLAELTALRQSIAARRGRLK